MNVTFWADDVAGTVRHLKSKGVTITMEPQHTEMGHGGGFSRLDRVRSIL
jgi:hypothetical protein